MMTAMERQFHRLALFLGTWTLAGVVGYAAGRWAGVDADTDLGNFGEDLKGIDDPWSLGVGVCVPVAGALLSIVIGRITHGWISVEARRDAVEFGNDAVPVFYNGLCFGAAALLVCAALDIGGFRAAYATMAVVSVVVAFLASFWIRE